MKSSRRASYSIVYPKCASWRKTRSGIGARFWLSNTFSQAVAARCFYWTIFHRKRATFNCTASRTGSLSCSSLRSIMDQPRVPSKPKHPLRLAGRGAGRSFAMLANPAEVRSARQTERRPPISGKPPIGSKPRPAWSSPLQRCMPRGRFGTKRCARLIGLLFNYSRRA